MALAPSESTSLGRLLTLGDGREELFEIKPLWIVALYHLAELTNQYTRGVVFVTVDSISQRVQALGDERRATRISKCGFEDAVCIAPLCPAIERAKLEAFERPHLLNMYRGEHLR